jgi:hypothetical protein
MPLIRRDALPTKDKTFDKTYEGMAHFASATTGETCAGCSYFYGPSGYYAKGTCKKFTEMDIRPKKTKPPLFPSHARACKYYEPKPPQNR